MSDELREEIARAMAEAANDYDGDVLQYVPYLDDADAILPIIARVRDEARAEGRDDGYDEGRRAALGYQDVY